MLVDEWMDGWYLFNNLFVKTSNVLGQTIFQKRSIKAWECHDEYICCFNWVKWVSTAVAHDLRSSACRHTFQRQTGAHLDEHTCRCICWSEFSEAVRVAVLRACVNVSREAFTLTQHPANTNPTFLLDVTHSGSSGGQVNRHLSTMC